MTGIDPVWPMILTNADWQKKKGAFAKVAGKSGVGEAMTAAEKAFKKIDWNIFVAQSILPAQRDQDVIVARKAASITAFKTTVEPTRVQLKKLRDVATKTAGDWKKSKLIPSSATKHVQDVAKAADFLFISLAGNSQVMTSRLKTFDDMLAAKKKFERDEIQKLDTSIENLEKALAAAAADPTKATWSLGSSSAHQRCRSMCNAIRNVPKLKTKYWSTWQPFGDEYNKDVPEGPREAEVMKKKIATVKTELAKFKANYKNDL